MKKIKKPNLCGCYNGPIRNYCCKCLGQYECPKSPYYCDSINEDYDGKDYSTALAEEIERQNMGVL